METTVFTPTYASFLAMLQMEGKVIKVVLDKTIKGAQFPWGFPGGKEEVEDKNNFLRTGVRESDEETSLAPGLELVEKIKIGTLHRRNDNPQMPAFLNHFHFLWLEGLHTPVIRNRKESIVEVGWFSLRVTESMALKVDHRIALVEMCYQLSEMATEDAAIAYSLMDLQYAKFKRPSENSWQLEVMEENKDEMKFFLPQHAYEVVSRRR